MAGIKMQEIESSNIEAAGFDKESSTMRIRFKSGNEYDYIGFPEDLYEDFLNAPSAGKYFSQNIRNQYRGEKV